ncbi:nucleotide-binding protein [Imperialibacter roseus]|uniref:Nucleotide-binding protein n=1 Tax=Imperialibacter roseus TaxID=1324217 RepID=A0ABZ0IVK2_9BACT|nr:nucleotide-binding protein [Imperialibacter roseus]WOK08174.1 nucleotide-binding protein [Imperialibacter roseus]
MAKRTIATKSENNNPTVLVVGREYFKEELGKRIVIGEEIHNRQIQTNRQFEQARQDYYDWNDFNSEFLKQSFNNPNNEYKSSYDNVNQKFIYVSQSPAEELQEFIEDVKNKVNNLRQLVAKTSLIKTEINEPIIAKTSSAASNKVFIVHGHNNEVKVNIARTVEKLGLEAIILHEQANSGKTIIEKFEEHSEVAFAIVLLTDDDFGKSKKADSLNNRARQNVILELGYFIGKLSRNKVCPLYVPGVELPSDLHGLLYIELDAEESWKFKLAKELKASGLDVDVNKIL